MSYHITTKPTIKDLPDDPLKVQQFVLSNGLKLFFSVNALEPRIHTEIAVRVGSKHDPADTTGLAHYFEHMMFKGTDKLGTLNWEKEKPLLDEIEATYEAHRTETDPEKKKALYAKIDTLSFEAAQYAVANEYDKLSSAIGAKNTNAYTWVEQTVYLNDIPSNELERWFQLEAERFRRPVLRLFHTELETVFEEFNISQDRDFRKTHKAMQEVLTPTHPYGTQTTLGRGEDLKNPSQTKIYKFFEQHYIPNNMAIVLAGDFNPDHALQLAQRYFGGFQEKKRLPFHFVPQPPLAARTVRQVWGNEPAWVEIGWRFDGAASEQTTLISIVAGMLYNQQAGLFDLNLIQQQKVLEAEAYPNICADYSSLMLYGKPRDHQTLEEVEQLLIAEVQKLATGDFEDWLPQAVVRDMQLAEFKNFENNKGRAAALTNAFVLGLEWEDVLRRRKQMQDIQKQDIVQFAQQWLRTDNYCVVFKQHGEDPHVMKVEKPHITPVTVNRTEASDFAQSFLSHTPPDIDPHFIDFQKIISKKKISDGVQLHAIQSAESKLFRLFIIWEMGKNADPLLPLAAQYLPFLGTSRRSAQQIQQEFYKLGIHFTTFCQDERMFLTLLGLPESLTAGLNLLYELLQDCQPDAPVLQNLVADVLQKRVNEKMEKHIILRQGMFNYAKFGSKNPFNTLLSESELKNLKPQTLTQQIKQWLHTRHTIFYHGALDSRAVAKILKNSQPPAPAVWQKPTPNRRFTELSNRRDEVLFVHFPMVQVEVLLLARVSKGFRLDEFILSEWFNQYFGMGLSSIVFQEIRESKALAYHAYAHFANPTKKHLSHYLSAYVSLQPDKLHTAVEAFQQLLNDMPVSKPQMEQARQSIIKQIAADRISLDKIYWNWRMTRDRGYQHDLRRDVYEGLQRASYDDLIAFHQQKNKGLKFKWLVMGERERIDFQYLTKIGRVRQLSLEEIFGC